MAVEDREKSHLGRNKAHILYFKASVTLSEYIKLCLMPLLMDISGICWCLQKSSNMLPLEYFFVRALNSSDNTGLVFFVVDLGRVRVCALFCHLTLLLSAASIIH